MKCLLPLAACCLLPVAWRVVDERDPSPLAPDRPLASLVPECCAVFVEGPGLARLLGRGLEHEFVSALLASPVGRALVAAAPLAPSDALARADAWLGAPAAMLAGELAARGAGLGLDPVRQKVVVVALASDGERAAHGLGLVLDALERQFGWPGAFDRPRRRSHGADVWTFGEELLVARREALLVIGNDADLLEETLALAADPGGRGLLARPGVERALAERPADAVLWSWLELEELEPLADDGFRELRAAERSPAAHGILGAQLAALASARALAASLVLGATGLELELRAQDAPSVASLAPLAREGAVPARPVSGGLGDALVYRDYARFLGERATLFPAETLPGFAEALTNGALFFEGRDLGEDVLSGVSPWLRLVAREIDFPVERRPEIPLPALAVVAVLDEPRDAEPWLAAFQALVSIINVDRAQQGGRSMRLVVEREGEVEVTSARHATPAPGEGIDVRYNLEPAVAACGRHLVLGTHAALVRDLVRELDGEAPLAASTAHETLALDARGLRRVLADVRAHLVARKMVEEGLDRAAAERELDGLARVLDSFSGLRIEVRGDVPAAPVLLIEVPFEDSTR